MSARTLRAVSRKTTPAPLAVGTERAARMYPGSEYNQLAYIAAVRWMQGRPGGSIWILDTNRPAPKWRALPKEQQQ